MDQVCGVYPNSAVAGALALVPSRVSIGIESIPINGEVAVICCAIVLRTCSNQVWRTAHENITFVENMAIMEGSCSRSCGYGCWPAENENRYCSTAQVAGIGQESKDVPVEVVLYREGSAACGRAGGT